MDSRYPTHIYQTTSFATRCQLIDSLHSYICLLRTQGFTFLLWIAMEIEILILFFHTHCLCLIVCEYHCIHIKIMFISVSPNYSNWIQPPKASVILGQILLLWHYIYISQWRIWSCWSEGFIFYTSLVRNSVWGGKIGITHYSYAHA